MNGLELLKFYSRRDIQKEILRLAQNREIAIKFGDRGYGKRPDFIQFENDILELAKKGATSFSISVEHWQDPLKLETAMNKKQLDDLRSGWDLLIDIDSKKLEHSKVAASLLAEALKIHDVKNFSIKYSGNRGFHLAIPYSAFPKRINNQSTSKLFPDVARIVATYLKYFISDQLKSSLKHESPFSLVDIDTIMFSSRHLFRSPYSINEKSGLVSIPIKDDNILDFNTEDAKTENVNTKIKFLPDSIKSKEASRLFVEALDWNSSNKKLSLISIKQPVQKRIFTQKENAITNEEVFPPCIKAGFQGLDDGKKRFIFIAINFLRNMGWKLENIQSRLLEWNKLNTKPLRDAYITSQVHWFKKQAKQTPPPNCDHQAYMVGIGICKPDHFCKSIKNPVNYPDKKLRLLKQKKSNK